MSKDSNRMDMQQEVDLTSISKSIGNMFSRLNSFFYRSIRFVLRNIVVLGVLFVVGAGLGYWIDKVNKGSYDTQLIVSPNFGSTDYLYATIDQLESKLNANDTAFLAKIGIKNPKKVREIKIEPIIDVFKFLSNSGTDQNYKLLELMAEDGDIKKIVTDPTTSKNYPYHVITITTQGPTTNEKTVTPLLNYLNDNSHFKKIQQEYLKNVEIKLKANDTMIAQIDDLLRGVSNETTKTSSVYIKENIQINDIIRTKDELVKEQGIHRVDLIGLDKIIKDNSVIANIKDDGGLNGKMKFALPIVLIFMFLCIFAFRSFYRSQSTKHQAPN